MGKRFRAQKKHYSFRRNHAFAKVAVTYDYGYANTLTVQCLEYDILVDEPDDQQDPGTEPSLNIHSLHSLVCEF